LIFQDCMAAEDLGHKACFMD